MPDSRGARIALELAFLAIVTAVLAATRVEPAWIVATMVVAWLLVALLEWVAWNDVPHWASGRPPRYHVPVRRLPPRPPTQELPRFSLQLRTSDAPTSIAPPELRDELLAAAASVALEQEDDWEPGWPDGHLHEAEPDPWVVAELPAAPEIEPEPEPEPEVVEVVAVVEAIAVEPEPELEPEPEAEPEPVAAVLARHRLDPFAETEERRWPWQRGESPPSVEVPARPLHRVGGRG